MRTTIFASIFILAAVFGISLVTSCDQATEDSKDYSATFIESISPSSGHIDHTSCDGFTLTIKFSGQVGNDYETVVIDGATYTEGDYTRTIIIDLTGYYHQLTSFNPDIVLEEGSPEILGIKISGIKDTEGIPVRPYSDPEYSLSCMPK